MPKRRSLLTDRGPGGLPGGGRLQRTGPEKLKATLLGKSMPAQWPCRALWGLGCPSPGPGSVRACKPSVTLQRPSPSAPCSSPLQPGVQPPPPPCTLPTLGLPSAIWRPWTLAATQAGSLSPWIVPECCGGRALRVTGTDPPQVAHPAPPAHRASVPHAVCSLLPPHQGRPRAHVMCSRAVSAHGVPAGPALGHYKPVDLSALDTRDLMLALGP